METFFKIVGEYGPRIGMWIGIMWILGGIVAVSIMWARISINSDWIPYTRREWALGFFASWYTVHILTKKIEDEL